jgi:hypothetical protein
MVFLGGSGVVLKFLKWLGGLWHKRQGSCEIWNFYGIFFIFGEVQNLFVIIF